MNTCALVKIYCKNCVKRPLSEIQKLGFQDQLSLNAGQKIQNAARGALKHSASLSTFIELPFIIKIFVLSILVAVLHGCTMCKPSV